MYHLNNNLDFSNAVSFIPLFTLVSRVRKDLSKPYSPEVKSKIWFMMGNKRSSRGALHNN